MLRRSLDERTLEAVHVMEEYADPYHGRAMTLGEIGCFLSHHDVWRRTARAAHSKVLVLEDDIRFEPFFKAKVAALVHELENLPQVDNWDLVYLGEYLKLPPFPNFWLRRRGATLLTQRTKTNSKL